MGFRLAQVYVGAAYVAVFNCWPSFEMKFSCAHLMMNQVERMWRILELSRPSCFLRLEQCDKENGVFVTEWGKVLNVTKLSVKQRTICARTVLDAMNCLHAFDVSCEGLFESCIFKVGRCFKVLPPFSNLEQKVTTPDRWLAPERLLNPFDAPSKRESDMWTFGCFFVELVGGQLPWKDCDILQLRYMARSLTFPLHLLKAPSWLFRDCFQYDPTKRSRASFLLRSVF